MAISKYVTPNLEGLSDKVSSKARSIQEARAAADINPAGDCSTCMFASNGACTAEWCIFKELPPMSGSRTVKCPMCGEEATASVYSGGSFILCDKCKKKMQEATDGSCIVCGSKLADDEMVICKECAEKVNDKVIDASKNCTICGATLGKNEMTICHTCAEKINNDVMNPNKTCIICGASSGNSDICSSCAGKIREKINE